jgi:hypothetical protein
MEDEQTSQSTESLLNKTFADKFFFIFELPEALKNLQPNQPGKNAKLGIDKKALQWSIVKAEVPNVNIKAAPINYGGGTLHYSTHTKSPYDPFKITFKVDSNYMNYFTIYEWINFIYGEKEGHFNEEKLTDSESFTSYAVPVSIVGLDEFNNPVIQWIFTYAFPTDLSSINLDYTSTDEIEFTATFVFSQMRIRNVLYDELKNRVSN